MIVRDPTNDCEFPDCPNAVTVSVRLDYGFFPGTTLREPTNDEYVGLVIETSRFYTDTLSTSFSNLATSIAVRASDSFMPGNANPVIVNFNVITFFNDGTALPSETQILAAINAANYNSESE